MDRFFILCIYGCTNYMEVVKGKEEVAEGILSLDVHHPEHQGIVFVAVYFMFLL